MVPHKAASRIQMHLPDAPAAHDQTAKKAQLGRCADPTLDQPRDSLIPFRRIGLRTIRLALHLRIIPEMRTFHSTCPVGQDAETRNRGMPAIVSLESPRMGIRPLFQDRRPVKPILSVPWNRSNLLLESKLRVSDNQ